MVPTGDHGQANQTREDETGCPENSNLQQEYDEPSKPIGGAAVAKREAERLRNRCDVVDGGAGELVECEHRCGTQGEHDEDDR